MQTKQQERNAKKFALWLEENLPHISMENSAEYRNMNTRVNFICQYHGKFYTRPSNMKVAIHGCQSCYHDSRKLDIAELKARLLAMHGDKIIFPEDLASAYNGKRGKVLVTCNQCKKDLYMGWEHLMRGNGCMSCYFKSTQTPYSDFLERAKAAHGTRYSYYNEEESEYVGVKGLVKIHCPKCGNDFKQKAYSHTRGHGCSICNHGSALGYDNEILFARYVELANEPCLLYYVKIGDMYKIGITKTSVDTRFTKKMNVETIYTRQTTRQYAWRAEQSILKYFTAHRSVHPTLTGGRSECFDTDISQHENFMPLFNADLDRP